MASGLVTAAGAWCGAALLLACSSAASPSASPSAVSRPPAAAGPCRVDAPKTSFEEVEVSVPGARFTLGLEEVPSQIELTEDDTTAMLHVQSPLVFSATLPRRLLQLRLAVATDFYGGRLHLAAGQDPSWLGVRGDHLLLSLEQSLGLVLDQPLALPCSHVTLRAPMQPWETPGSDVLADATPIGMGPEPFLLYSRPEGTDAVRLRYGGPVTVVETRPGWWRIVAVWTDGTRLDGWTSERARSSRYEERLGEVGGISGRIQGGVVDGPIIWKARLHAGATIAAAPAGPSWARAPVEVEVEVSVGGFDGVHLDRWGGWLPVVTVPGLLPPPSGFRYVENTWVHLSELTLLEPDAVETDTSSG